MLPRPPPSQQLFNLPDPPVPGPPARAVRNRGRYITNWRTHSHPAAGARPQALLNKQVVDRCDILVGVFRLRFGTPTGVADSGTEEAIRRCTDLTGFEDAFRQHLAGAMNDLLKRYPSR
jgi:hypothetical protein